MKKGIILTVLVLFAYSLKSNAQSTGYSYRTALGVKVWDGGGISLKHFTGKNAVEGIAYFWSHGFRLTGLYEIHGDFNGAEGLKWYIGPGAHVAFYNSGYHDQPDSYAAIGIDGVIGLDYKFSGAPINLSLDWQPSFEFGKETGFIGSWGGFAVRYTF